MPQYPYRPELKKPGTLGGIDFSNPALAPMVRMVVQNLRRAVRAWSPPKGLVFGRFPSPLRTEKRWSALS